MTQPPEYIIRAAVEWLYEETVRRCHACRRFEDSSAKIGERYRRCSACGAGLTPIGEWRFYTAEEFHRATLAACGNGGPR